MFKPYREHKPCVLLQGLCSPTGFVEVLQGLCSPTGFGVLLQRLCSPTGFVFSYRVCVNSYRDCVLLQGLCYPTGFVFVLQGTQPLY